MASPSKRVSVILPAYNEFATLKTNVEKLRTVLKSQFGQAYEIVLAENGSTDDTPELVRTLAERYDDVSFVTLTDAGRGGAIAAGVRAASAPTVVYIDADLSFDLTVLPNLVESVEDGSDIAAASRWKRNGVCYKSVVRTVLSYSYNLLLRIGFGSSIRDHQCGYKAFNREVVIELLDDLETEGWFWDAELLLQAQYRGLQVKEYPTSWTETGDSSVNVVRDVARIGRAMGRFWLRVTLPHRLRRK